MSSIIDFIPDLKRKSEKEFAGPCPWCGGTDRFIAWPTQRGGGRFTCRQCKRSGDAIDYLRSTGLSFADARARLEIESPVRVNENCRVGSLGDLGLGSSRVKQNEVNREQWKASAKSFIEFAVSHHNSTSISDWHQSLKSRHLTIETAMKFKIGWNPHDLYVPGRSWGIETGKIKIPRGLVIPIYGVADLVGVKIRRPIGTPKYWQIRGSENLYLVLGEKALPTVIVESELDAYLIWQEAHLQAAVVAGGGSTKPIDSDTLEFLYTAPKILISTDYDEPKDDGKIAGQSAYLSLKKQFPGAEYLPAAQGKDPTEMHTLGIPVKLWIDSALGVHYESDISRLPESFPGSWQWFKQMINNFPHLVPCSKTAPQWNWKHRSACSTCSGHISCVKNLRF